MPQAELNYSSDLDINAEEILAEIEAAIREHDSGAGACKGRACAADRYHHSHLAVRVTLLPKPHRDAAFSEALLAKLDSRIRAALSQPCALSVELGYFSPFYATGPHPA